MTVLIFAMTVLFRQHGMLCLLNQSFIFMKQNNDFRKQSLAPAKQSLSNIGKRKRHSFQKVVPSLLCSNTLL